MMIPVLPLKGTSGDEGDAAIFVEEAGGVFVNVEREIGRVACEGFLVLVDGVISEVSCKDTAFSLALSLEGFREV